MASEDMIFCLPQLQEKCIEQDRPLYMVFVNHDILLSGSCRVGLVQLLSLLDVNLQAELL